jgi:formate dehydrogenase major subunit
MLRKKVNGVANGPRLSSALNELTGGAIDRRTFLRNSGLAIGGLAALKGMRSGMVTKAEAASPAGGAIEIKKSVCTHCSVGCTVLAEVQNGVWIGRSPVLTARSILALIALRALRCASTPMASGA